MSSLALGLFPAWHPDWGPGLAWGTALAVRWLALHETELDGAGRPQPQTF